MRRSPAWNESATEGPASTSSSGTSCTNSVPLPGSSPRSRKAFTRCATVRSSPGELGLRPPKASEERERMFCSSAAALMAFVAAPICATSMGAGVISGDRARGAAVVGVSSLPQPPRAMSVASSAFVRIGRIGLSGRGREAREGARAFWSRATSGILLGTHPLNTTPSSPGESDAFPPPDCCFCPRCTAVRLLVIRNAAARCGCACCASRAGRSCCPGG